MIPVSAFDGMPVGVLGLGSSGLAAAAALKAGGADPWAWDDDPKRREAARARAIKVVDLATCAWDDLTTLVLSPGIPHTWPTPHKIVALARRHSVEIVGDVELLARAQRQASFVGVTGTNGKSTTTALIGHVLRACGRRVEVGGNIGTPALALNPLGRDGIYVLELSSYQLETVHSATCNLAVLLNVSPDHLDRHGGMDGYVAAKRRIFRHQGARDAAVIGVDDETCRAIAGELAAARAQRVVPVSSGRAVAGGVFASEGKLFDALDGPAREVMDLRSVPTLPGAHNGQNAAACYAAARCLGLDGAAVCAAIATYPGLPHRQEMVANVQGVRFVNDSKATNADAAARALGCYDAIYWIAGGRPKAGGIRSLAEYFPRIRHAYLIGEAAQDFAATLGHKVPFAHHPDLASAVHAAAADARRERAPGAVVLLSPACASFDQFPNFEVRGERFRAIAREIALQPAEGTP